ncbi:MAG: hypothetical protein QM564_04820 [Bergeyella sp.]
MKNFVFLITLIAHLNAFSQENSILGKWVLEKTTYADGKALEVNHPLYSSIQIYYISPGSFMIGPAKYDAQYEKNAIKLNLGQINYFYQDNYLITTSQDNSLLFYFLKERDFLSKYPEFSPHIKKIDNKDYYISNTITEPVFFSQNIFEIEISNYITNSKINGLYDFEIEFIFDKSKRNPDYHLVNSSLDKKQEDEIKKILERLSNSFINTFEENLIYTKNIRYNSGDFNQNKDKPIVSIDAIKKLEKLYNENRFDELIKEVEKLQKKETDSKKVPNRVKIWQGVSYLAINKMQDACNVFRTIGDVKNFQVRNYLINFCKKN